jgi:hypothetical protein
MPVEGCGDEGKSQCAPLPGEVELNIRRANEFRQTTERNQCKAGNKLHCSYAENHPVETATFTATALIGGPLVEEIAFGGGLAGATDWALWRAGLSCISNAICRTVTGMAGGAGSVWNQNPLQRGQTIETQLGRSPQLVNNFPVIDRFENGTATSIKSIDLTTNTYQNIANLTNKIRSYGNTLAGWQGTGEAGWGGVVITNEAIVQRELLLAVPPNATQSQLAALQQLQTWGQSIGIQINIVVVP